MVLEEVDIESIQIGQRRREDMGDLDGLARNIDEHGLLHPIIIAADNELIAGERRLRACRQLGYDTILVRRWPDLTPEERREIELAENLNRKDLTAIERSRNLVDLAETAAQVLRDEAEAAKGEVDSLPTVGNESKRGGQPKADAGEKVAQRIGTPRQTVDRAQEHVAAVETYPFMEDPAWRQGQALEAKHYLDRLPEADRPEAVTLISQPGIAPEHAIPMLGRLSTMPPEQRAEIFRLQHSDDSRDRSLALTKAIELPPMPDPRLTSLNRAIHEVRIASKEFPNDPITPRLSDALKNLREIAKAIKEQDQHGYANQHAVA